MPTKHTFLSKASKQQVIYGRAEESLLPNGTMIATKSPTLLEFVNGRFETTSDTEAEFIRERIKTGNLEAWEISQHAQATPEHVILARVSEVLMMDDQDEKIASLREMYKEEVDGPKREAVTGPLLEIFRKLGVSENKPGRPKS